MGGGATGSGSTYSVGGSISGLSGTVVLQDNGGDDLTLTANGPFTFATKLASAPPTPSPSRRTRAARAAASPTAAARSAAADVTNVAVSCTANPTYAVGGSISGLSGTVVLQDNGGDDLSVSANGPFAFATKLATGAAYNVTVKTNPSGQSCSVANGSGTIGSADVSNVAVSCANSPTYAVGGSVSGLSGTVVLQDNGGDDLSVSANGPFTFATKLAGGAAYNVTVKTNPSGQSCSVANGSGTIGAADVTNVAVSCATNPTYAVGGSVSGLSGTVVLQDNGGDDLSVSANGPFTFATSSPAAPPTTSPSRRTRAARPAASPTAAARSARPTSATWPSAAPPNPTYSVGGSVSGLSGTVVLQDNGGDDLSVSANGPFIFATKLAGWRRLQRHRQDEPERPDLQRRQRQRHDRLGRRHATWPSAAPPNPTYAVGGSVSGLSGTVVLQDNGGDDLSVSANGPFTFATKLAGGAAYNVTVKTNPSGQSCSVANGSGTIAAADVTNVAVSCAATGSAGSDDFNRPDGSLGASWVAISDGALSIASQAVRRHERNRRRHPHRGDVHQRPVVPDRAHLDAALGRAVGWPDRPHPERRPEHLPRDLLLERRQSSSSASTSATPAPGFSSAAPTTRGRCPPARRCS